MVFIKSLTTNELVTVVAPTRSIDFVIRDECLNIPEKGIDIEINGIDTEPVLIHLDYRTNAQQIFGDLSIELRRSNEQYPRYANLGIYTSYLIKKSS